MWNFSEMKKAKTNALSLRILLCKQGLKSVGTTHRRGRCKTLVCWSKRAKEGWGKKKEAELQHLSEAVCGLPKWNNGSNLWFAFFSRESTCIFSNTSKWPGSSTRQLFLMGIHGLRRNAMKSNTPPRLILHGLTANCDTCVTVIYLQRDKKVLDNFCQLLNEYRNKVNSTFEAEYQQFVSLLWRKKLSVKAKWSSLLQLQSRLAEFSGWNKRRLLNQVLQSSNRYWSGLTDKCLHMNGERAHTKDIDGVKWQTHAAEVCLNSGIITLPDSFALAGTTSATRIKPESYQIIPKIAGCVSTLNKLCCISIGHKLTCEHGEVKRPQRRRDLQAHWGRCWYPIASSLCLS